MDKFSRPFTPDADALIANIRRQGTPRRAHNMELFLDGEIQDAIVQRFGLAKGLKADDPAFPYKKQIALARFLGYDYIHTGLEVGMSGIHEMAQDVGPLARAGGRRFINEHRGPIGTWEDFEKFAWPDPMKAPDTALAWYDKNLPDDMCLIGGANAHFCEYLCWLMGYETLCYALHDQRDLVAALYLKFLDFARKTMLRLAQYKRVKAVWGSDDMGFKTGPLISPADMREFVLPGHKAMADMAHQQGWVYLLHACGNLKSIMPDLVSDVKIDAKHSFEDTIEKVTDAKQSYGRDIALLGGLDVDFMCRADEQAVRARVRATLDACLPGGGYCLGTGNSVANYIPVDNYLAMLDEGRRYC
jgi:uroporphyrinogen decarboxylase